MTALSEIVQKVRAKNAGPFWLTLEVFCGTHEVYGRVSRALKDGAVADLFQTDPDALKRFDIADLNVVKFSLPRPHRQGARTDRDMHGASYAALLAEVEI